MNSGKGQYYSFRVTSLNKEVGERIGYSTSRLNDCLKFMELLITHILVYGPKLAGWTASFLAARMIFIKFVLTDIRFIPIGLKLYTRLLPIQ